MAKEPVQIKGVELDTQILQKITKELKPRATRIVKAYGNMMLAGAVRRAPVDTGALINSMTANSKMVEELTYRLQDGVEYGRRHELGFHGKDSLGRLYFYAGRPFMRPAIEELRQKFLDAFKGLFKT